MTETDEIAAAIIYRHGGTIPRDARILRQFVAALMPGQGAQAIDNVTEAIKREIENDA